MISVAMAVYNGEKFIEKQIDSIMKQLSSDDELVISINESTDNSLEVINKKAEEDKRIKVINNPDKGVTQNFNCALLNCSGDYIYISDQDDIWKDNKIETVQKYLEGEYDVLFHNFISINEYDEIISKPFFDENVVNTSRMRTFFKPRQSGCCMAFKKSFVEKYIPMPLKVESYDHWLAMVSVKKGKVIVIDDVLIEHRLHSNNVTEKKKRSIFKIFKSRWDLLMALLFWRKK